jgi:hypothetical protein
VPTQSVGDKDLSLYQLSSKVDALADVMPTKKITKRGRKLREKLRLADLDIIQS